MPEYEYTLYMGGDWSNYGIDPDQWVVYVSSTRRAANTYIGWTIGGQRGWQLLRALFMGFKKRKKNPIFGI